jgi:carboxymethylenebutenolidase
MGSTGAAATVHYRSGQVGMAAYLARPESPGPHPGLIVIQEWWGLNEHIKDVTRRFAREGYVALAPDLYSRLGHKVTSDPNEAAGLMNALKPEQALDDLRATMAFLQAAAGVDPARIGVVGFCMGGTYALLLPCYTGDINAAVPFYGQVPNPPDPLRHLTCPVLYIYGDADGWITMADVNRLREALQRYGKAGEVRIYPGAPHAFFNDTRKDVYRAAEAQDAWRRVRDFLARHLNPALGTPGGR